ncbi:unnamed protein product, partial [marine sediment metagenome]
IAHGYKKMANEIDANKELKARIMEIKRSLDLELEG